MKSLKSVVDAKRKELGTRVLIERLGFVNTKSGNAFLGQIIQGSRAIPKERFKVFAEALGLAEQELSSLAGYTAASRKPKFPKEWVISSKDLRDLAEIQERLGDGVPFQKLLRLNSILNDETS